MVGTPWSRAVASMIGRGDSEPHPRRIQTRTRRRRPNTWVCARRLEAHTDTLSSVAASTATVATGAWDCSVRLWQWHKLYAAAADAASGGDEPAGKRSRGAVATAGAPADGVHAAAVVTECAAVLGDHSQVRGCRVSCNMERGMRVWHVWQL